MGANRKGRYEGRAIVEFGDEQRIVRLVERFAFIDCQEKTWEVPADARVDGASIPRLLWTIIGGPFEGKYRNASIIHDWYCDRRTRPWERVHEIFYEAMLTSGVSATQARILYTGVLLGGPRWSLTAVANNNLADQIPPAAPPPPRAMAPGTLPGLGYGGHVSFARPTASKPVKRAPAKAPKPAKPRAYSYELNEADLRTIQAIASQTSDLGQINKLVQHELKGRKRK
ncbi:MAG TPA: DUF1353 domain-containing protein [Edaphobacter sp.]